MTNVNARQQPLHGDGDASTSVESADVIRPKLGKIQQEVIEAIQTHGPMAPRIAEKLPEFAHYEYSTIRKRFSELHRSGELVKVGVDRTGRAPSAIYDLTEELKNEKSGKMND
jgi:hypothetical protein